MKRGIVVVLFLGNSNGDLEAAEGRTRSSAVGMMANMRLAPRARALPSPEEEVVLPVQQWPGANPKSSFLIMQEEEIEDEVTQQDVRRARKECRYPWNPRIAYQDGGRTMLLTFFPPGDRPRRYVVELNEGVFSGENFTVDMTQQAIRSGFQVGERGLNPIVANTSTTLEQKQDLVRDLDRGARLVQKNAEERCGRHAKNVRLYRTSFPLEERGEIVFFCCRALVNGRPVTFIAELANLDDIDSWLVGCGKGSEEGVADRFIASVTLERP